MKVPFLDLKPQYESIKEEINDAIQEVLESCAFAGGPFVEKFEKEFAEFCQCKYCVGVGSGTEALWLALLAKGVGPGDEVITVPSTFIATAEAISFCGATPVFVDIDEKTYTMDPNKLEDYLNKRFALSSMRSAGKVKALIPVHLYGQTADMGPILEIARTYELAVIEDAAQAHGAEYEGRPAGSTGDAGCFSFYPGKNLGAYGEAGAVVTTDESIAQKIRILRDHGQQKKYFHDAIGWNSRMDGLQGAVLSVKLKHLPKWNDLRREAAHQYSKHLEGIDELILPFERQGSRHIYHIYSVRLKGRNNFMKALQEKEVHCAIHYPVPIHLQEAYRFLGLETGAFPVSEICADEVVSLPMFAELGPAQVRNVASIIKKFFTS